MSEEADTWEYLLTLTHFWPEINVFVDLVVNKDTDYLRGGAQLFVRKCETHIRKLRGGHYYRLRGITAIL